MRREHPLDSAELRALVSGPVSLAVPSTPSAATSTIRLACLALRQAGFWGEPAFPVQVPHHRFSGAVEAAKSHMGQEAEALAAACLELER